MKTRIDSLLIPTDFSDPSESALKAGIAIAKRQNAEITVLHVVDRSSSDILMTPAIMLTLEEKLKKLTEKIQKEEGLKVTGKILEGNPSELICQLASEENISLIVNGTHGKSGVQENSIGSEALSVVENSVCPVLTIPGNWNKTDFEKVLFPVRINQGMLVKYFYSRPIIEQNNSELFLLGLTEHEYSGDVKEIALLMDEIKILLHNDKVVFQSAICRTMDFSGETIKISKDYKVDLIILTPNSDRDFKLHFIGQYAQQVLNLSRIPVLSIKPE